MSGVRRPPMSAPVGRIFSNPDEGVHTMSRIALARVFERVDRDGKRFMTGRIGSAKLLIVPTGAVSRGEPVWQVILGEGFYEEHNLPHAGQAAEDKPKGTGTASSRKTLRLPVR